MKMLLFFNTRFGKPCKEYKLFAFININTQKRSVQIKKIRSKKYLALNATKIRR